MNILFVVPYVPNQIRVRPYNLIRYLSQLGHRITLLTIWTNEDELEAIEQLEEYCDQVRAINLPAWRSFYNCLLALPTKQPLQAVYCWDESLADEILEISTLVNGSNTIDIVHVEHLRGARYGVNLKSRLSDRRPSLPVIWDSVDSISLLFRQAMVQSKSLLSRGLTWFDLNRTEHYEGWLLSKFDQVLVTSENDKRALLSLNKYNGDEPGIRVLPNGVDLGYFTPPRDMERENKVIVLSGKMSYHANITMSLDFVQKIMPQVWEKHPDVQVWIVGKDPPANLQALNQNPNVKVTGTVEDIRPYLQKATLSASPISYGAGIQNKVLEALACATPVVASKQAISALDVNPGEEILVADDPLTFANNVISLLEDPERREEIGTAGRRFVEKNHDWTVVASRLEDVYTYAIEKRGEGKPFIGMN
jgi:sugar transferase (PEP-CTERM/EpsH1 system associated)